jgi:Cu-Zn family superoxide dismutase
MLKGIRDWTFLLALSSLLGAGCDKGPKDAPKPVSEPMKDAPKAVANDLGATAELLNAKGDKVGTAKFTPVKEGVKIHAELSKLPPGAHAMHLHTVGECHGPDFKSAGAHFNPFDKKHGLKNPLGPHAGDLPNFDVKSDGTAMVDITATLVTLGEGKNSLFQPGGTCIVVHEKADDETSDPAGNAGQRIACGVIKKQ